MIRISRIDDVLTVIVPAGSSGLYRIIQQIDGKPTIGLGIPMARIRGDFMSGGFDPIDEPEKADDILEEKNTIVDFASGVVSGAFNLESTFMMFLEGVPMP